MMSASRGTLTPMTLVQRLAIAVGALCLAGAALAVFLPTSPEGAVCGTWVAPEWGDEETQELLEKNQELAKYDELLGDNGSAGRAVAIAESKRLCDDALGTRRTVSIALLILGVVGPALVLFVGRRPRVP